MPRCICGTVHEANVDCCVRGCEREVKPHAGACVKR